jgi:RNA polymerase sigma-70 factor, ECF subfamily
MTADDLPNISGLLAGWANGDEEALGRWMSFAYPELRRIARQHLGRGAAGNSLESAALANEAYLKLIRARGIRCESRVHFLALCSQAIRRILVDHARNHMYAKRGGDAVLVPLAGQVVAAGARQVGVLALDEVLAALSEFDPRARGITRLRNAESLKKPGSRAGQVVSVSSKGTFLPYFRKLLLAQSIPDRHEWLRPP